MTKNISIYHQNAESLHLQYSSVSFETAHQSWQQFWPVKPSCVLDVGAGCGRDAAWFEKQNCEVIAVEPAQAMREIGQKNTGVLVRWLDDQLPALHKVQALGMRFDLILLSAVWMHLPPSERERSFRKLINLLAPNGILVISLRHGDFSDGRTAFTVSAQELQIFASQFALMNVLCTDLVTDQLGRNEVHWQTMAFRLPDDGSGNLIKVRKIIINDNKTATYKLALLRILVRIADAHPGAVIERYEGKVYLPLGLIALYWIRLYKRLINQHGLQQSTNAGKGLGFVKPEGWGKLAELTADDFVIGGFFCAEQAQALQILMQDCITTIKKGPVEFIYHADKADKLFSIQSKRRQTHTNLVINFEFLSEFGYFILDEAQWECFRLYGSWIDPLLVQQMISEMQSYQQNKIRQIGLQTYYDALQWLEKDHDTRLVRKKVQELQGQGIKISSVWSNVRLADKFHVDHCLPFSYWPNNDQWNLMPATEKENLSKNNRLPSRSRLMNSRERILDWWQQAWQLPHEVDRFFHEANLSLPNMSRNSQDFDEVFDALQFQIHGVKQRLQIAEW